MVPILVRFAPEPGVQYVAYQWGMVRVCVAWYTTLLHALDHIGKWSTVVRFQTGSARVWFAVGVFKHPSGVVQYVYSRGMARFHRRPSECTPRKFLIPLSQKHPPIVRIRIMRIIQ